MNTENKPQKCLSREYLEDLAIRFTTEGEAPKSPGEGSPGVMPADLFMPEEAEIRVHLEDCQFCKLRLLSEIHQRREYLKSIKELDNESRNQRFDKNATRTIRFKYAPYNDDAEGGSLAASTAGSRTMPLRFESQDKKMLIKQEFIQSSDLHVLQIYGKLPLNQGDLYLLIDGVKYSVDADGGVDLKGKSWLLNPESDVYLEF